MLLPKLTKHRKGSSGRSWQPQKCLCKTYKKTQQGKNSTLVLRSDCIKVDVLKGMHQQRSFSFQVRAMSYGQETHFRPKYRTELKVCKNALYPYIS